MFGYEFNKAVAAGTLYVLNKTLTKAELDTFVGKTSSQIQADSSVLAYSSVGNTTIVSSGVNDSSAVKDRCRRYKRHYKLSGVTLTTTLTQLRNGEIKGLAVALGSPCDRLMFFKFGVGEESTSVHKYIATETPSPSVAFTIQYQDSL